MFKKIRFQIIGIKSSGDKLRVEVEIEALKGVKSAFVREKTDEAEIEFDDNLISRGEIFSFIEQLGFKARENSSGAASSASELVFYVQGMHCASCEVLIEKKLLSLTGIKAVQADAGKGEVFIEYTGKKPSTERLNSLFRKDNYVFSNEPTRKQKGGGNEFFIIAGTVILVIVGFLSLNKLGLSGLVNVSTKSSLPVFFVFGLLAGVSSCAALIGGIVLSMSKQWLELHADKKSDFQKLQPHLLFTAGRLASYAILGGALGVIGSKLQISLRFTSLLIIAISVMMAFLGLQMLGVRAFRKFQFALPKFVTRRIADEANFKGRYMPFVLGALTFFLPCGFTITAQGLALISGNPIQGALIMFLFALGTAPALLAIGFSSIKFSSRPHLAYRFAKVAGILILFFALFNINNQMNILGFTSLNDLRFDRNAGRSSVRVDDAVPIIDGKQVMKMDAAAYGYSPNYFKVKAGVPVRWEITDKGTSGCTNAVIANGLFSGEIDLSLGQTSVKEFTPQKSGKYKFSCWMGMISGVIEVVDKNSAIVPVSTAADNSGIIPSGAKGCGCGGGGGGASCGAGQQTFPRSIF